MYSNEEVSSMLRHASNLFRTKLYLDGLNPIIESARSQGKLICRVKSSEHADKFVYKCRNLNPFEFVEMERVLQTLKDDECQNIAQLNDFVVSDFQIHLLLEDIEGYPLVHYHNESWKNSPEFVQFIMGLSYQTKLKISGQLIHAIHYLHGKHLIFQDLKIDQVILRKNMEPVLVDLDSIVLEHGICSEKFILRSELFSPPHSNCCKQNDVFQLGCLLYELFSGRHAFSGEDFINNMKVKDVIMKMVIKYDTYTILEALHDFGVTNPTEKIYGHTN